jgi:7-cyano-7-deazaguanine synthase in queuosine biosynthesis
MNGINVLQVPENGLIALNVPLDDLRIGSHSTRTTHPFYMNLWNQVLSELGLPYSIENPYWNKTKDEMAVECLNKDFLLQVIKESTSCSSPQKARWLGQPSQHCGYCVPCLIRRSAMHKAYGLENDTTTYSAKSISEIIDAHAK